MKSPLIVTACALLLVGGLLAAGSATVGGAVADPTPTPAATDVHPEHPLLGRWLAVETPSPAAPLAEMVLLPEQAARVTWVLEGGRRVERRGRWFLSCGYLVDLPALDAGGAGLPSVRLSFGPGGVAHTLGVYQDGRRTDFRQQATPTSATGKAVASVLGSWRAVLRPVAGGLRWCGLTLNEDGTCTATSAFGAGHIRHEVHGRWRLLGGTVYATFPAQVTRTQPGSEQEGQPYPGSTVCAVVRGGTLVCTSGLMNKTLVRGEPRPWSPWRRPGRCRLPPRFVR